MTPEEKENALRAQARRCAEELTKAMSVKPKPKWNSVCPPHPSQALREGPAYGRQSGEICQCYWPHEWSVWSGIMKERGMIFNGEMVRAILAGRKTQTRRAVSDRHLHMIDMASQAGECYPLDSGTDHSNSQSYYREWCPFGTVGDRIWVRETFATLEPGSYEPVKPQQGYCQELRYAATDRLAKSDSDIRGYKWIPSLHMPRWASRILLEITDVRVERLNSISDCDAIREGCSAADMKSGDCMADVFARLWASIYGEENWEANSWVWVIEFKRVEGGAA